jgi:2-hydroxychromene-2-carboxylate isomerase
LIPIRYLEEFTVKSVDIFWSFRSPYSYLSTPEILVLSERYDVKINIRIVFPIAIRSPEVLFSKGGEQKVAYILLDWQRRAQMLNMPHKWPSPDPVVMDMETMSISEDQPYIYWLSYLGVEAERRGRGPEFIAEVSRVIWGGTANWHEGDHLEQAAARAGLDLDAMEKAIQDGDHRSAIDKNHEALDEAGHWGVPTFVFEGEPFFGQDRIQTLRWRLDQHGLNKY